MMVASAVNYLRYEGCSGAVGGPDLSSAEGVTAARHRSQEREQERVIIERESDNTRVIRERKRERKREREKFY